MQWTDCESCFVYSGITSDRTAQALGMTHIPHMCSKLIFTACFTSVGSVTHPIFLRSSIRRRVRRRRMRARAQLGSSRSDRCARCGVRISSCDEFSYEARVYAPVIASFDTPLLLDWKTRWLLHSALRHTLACLAQVIMHAPISDSSCLLSARSPRALLRAAQAHGRQLK